MTTLYIGLGLIALFLICVSIIAIQARRIKNYRTENEGLRQENSEAASRLLAIREYMSKNKIIMEEADEKREELKKTHDNDLAARANNLFGGVREPSGGS